MTRPLRQRKPVEPVNLSERRPAKDRYLRVADVPPNTAERFLTLIEERWRGHEPEIAVLAAITFILACAAVFAGADVFFTVMLVVAAGITIWSPWRTAR